ncbi:MAG: restriction endonuclease subunit S [Polyangia bacterium]
MSEEELPEGWAEAELGELANIVGGGTPPAKESANFCTEGGYPWLTPADLSGFEGMYVSRGERNLTREGLAASSAKLMPAGTVLMSSRAPIGYLAVAANEICTNQGFKSFICSDALQPEYVLFWLKAINHELQEMGSGSTFAEISGGRAKEIPVQFPPLAEQRRIVEKVEALLAQVNAARARLAKVPTTLKRFRQSILSAACSGRLTEDASTREPWEDTSLGELVESSFYGPRFSDDDYTTDGIPTIRTSDMDREGRIVFSSPPRVHLEGADLARLGLRDGDLLVTRTGATIGKCAVYSASLGPALPSAYLIRFRLKADRILPRFALLFLMSPEGQACLTGGATATAQPNVNAKAIASFPISVPLLEEQHEIVRRVDALFNLADAIEARVAAATARADKITQAILAKAFRGELVPTEAELARQEGRDYEPASALLARIRAARAATPAKASTGRAGQRASGRVSSEKTGARR